MSLYILDLTGSAAVFSRILAVSTIPYILFAPLAGFIADRINRKK
jgi:MFS family permease